MAKKESSARRSSNLRERRAQQDGAAGAHDAGGGRDALDRLVEAGIQGGAAGRDDHEVGRFVEGRVGFLLDEVRPLRVRGFGVAAEDANDAALAVERHVHQEVGARAAQHLEKPFVQRVSLEDAGPYPALDHRGAVRHPHRLGGREPGAEDLAAAGVARHQVRLDHPGQDPEIPLEVEAVDADRDSAGGRPEVGVGSGVARIVLHDAKAARELGAEHLVELGRGVRAMQAGCDLDGDRFRGQPGPVQRLQDGWQEHGVRHRTRDVGDDDHRVAATERQLVEGGRAARRGQRRAQNGVRIRDRGDRLLFQHVHVCAARERLLRQLDR